MKFLTLEDLHGTFEVVLFPEAYKRHGFTLTSHAPYLVDGVVKNHNGSIAVVGENIQIIPQDGNPGSEIPNPNVKIPKKSQ